MRKDPEEFLAIVREGLGEMPPISARELSDDQIRSVGRYLQSLAAMVAESSSGSIVAAGATSPEKKDILATLETAGKAVREKDVATLQRVYDDTLTYGEPFGRTLTKAQKLASALAGGTAESIECSEADIQMLGSAAVARCSGNVEGRSDKETVTHEFNVQWVLVEHSVGWQIMARQTSLLR